MMAEILEGLVINPKKKRTSRRRKRTRARKNPAKVYSIVKPKRGGGTRKVGELVIKNPANDTKALLMIASGTAFGLAGGKLLETMLKPRVPQLSALTDKGIPVGDIAVIAGGMLGLKKSRKNKEFFLGLVAGSASRAILNLIDTFVFKGKGLVSLKGDEISEGDNREALPPTEDVEDEAIPAEVIEEDEDMNPDTLALPEDMEDMPVDEMAEPELSGIDTL